MRLRALLVAAPLLLGLASCGVIWGVTIADLNLQPAKYYEQKVKITGRISRSEDLSGEALLELADERNRRIYVRAPLPVDAAVGDWVKIEGVLVPEATVGDRTLYDVVVAEHVEKTRAPHLQNLF
jgi:hypothetical protein